MAGSYCRITIYDDDRWIRVECAINDEFIKSLKEYMPYYHRIWDQDSRVWSINPEYKTWLLEEAQKRFNNVIIIENGQACLVKG
jgi:hypothetical protein